MIRNFPDFRRLSGSDYKEYERFTRVYPSHCDFSLNNLLVWLSGEQGVELCRLNNNLVLRVTDPVFQNTPEGVWYTVLGSTKTDETLHTIFEDPTVGKLAMVPDYFVEALKDPQRYRIVQDLSNTDYIFDVESLLYAPGGRFEQYRYQVSSFIKTYGHMVDVEQLFLDRQDHAQCILDSMARWPYVLSFNVNGNDADRTDHRAVERLIKIQNRLTNKHYAIGVFVDGQLEGFSIYHERMYPRPIAMGNHIKHNARYKRMFDFLVYVTASMVYHDGIALINGEQDMGIDGIRHHKLRLNPVDFYRKYTVSR